MTNDHPNAASRVYAGSLFDLAKSTGGKQRVEQAAEELGAIVELTRADKRFAQFLAAPGITPGQREQSLRKIFKGRVSEQTLHFLLVLNEKHRLGELGGVAAAFDELLQQHFGVVEADVFTAEPLGAEDLRGVSDRLAKALGKQVVAHNYAEPAMLGGIKVRIGDQLVDASLSTRLRKMKDQIRKGGLDALRSNMGRVLGA
jgi:F-type H+-transporting ATPase subunit delta